MHGEGQARGSLRSPTGTETLPRPNGRWSRGRVSWDGQRDVRAAPCGYLDSHTVVSHGDARVAVPAHVHGCVGTVVALPVQGATRGVYVIFGLLF